MAFKDPYHERENKVTDGFEAIRERIAAERAEREAQAAAKAEAIKARGDALAREAEARRLAEQGALRAKGEARREAYRAERAAELERSARLAWVRAGGDPDAFRGAWENGLRDETLRAKVAAEAARPERPLARL